MADVAKIKEELREAQNGVSQLRESVVTAVMQRNKLADDVTRLERLITDLETKAALAERSINNSSLAGELRTERMNQEVELARVKALLLMAESESEEAKRRLPDEETQLRRRIQELQSQVAALESGRVADSAASRFSTNSADAMLERASDKIRDLQAEASARSEIAATNGTSVATAPTLTPEQSADKMLRELEARYALKSEAAAPTPENPGRYLEFDSSDEAPPVVAASSSESVSAPEMAAPANVIPLPPPPAPPAPITPTPSAPAPAAPRETAVAATTETAQPTEPIKPVEPIEPPPAPPNSPVPDIDLEPSVFSERRQAIPPSVPFQVVVRPQRSAPPSDDAGRVRVAAIGTGGIFRGAHLPAYVDIPQMKLVALCDPDSDAQDQAYRRYQLLMEAKIKQANDAGDFTLAERFERDLESVQICDDISEVIETIKPDVVDICTQPFLHAPLAIQALEAGIHVVCEKPISRSWLESQRVIAAVERSGKLYQHNENWLWDKDYYTAKKLIDSGAIGEPLLMFLATAHGGPEGNPKFWNPDFGGGGSLLDNGIHAIGAAWFMSGLDKTPTLVKSAEPFGMTMRMPERILDGRYQKIRVEDDAHILIRFEHSESLAWTTAHIEGSWSHRDSPDTAIIGSTGRIVFKDEDSRRYALVMDAYDREARRIEVSGPTWSHWPSSYYGEILNFIECVKHNAPSISDAKFGAECSAMVGAAYLSEQRGRKAVPVAEFKQFANDLAAKYPNDPAGADNALVDALLSAVQKG